MTVILTQADSEASKVRQKRLSVPPSLEQLEVLEKIADMEKRSMGAQAALIIESWLQQYQHAPKTKSHE